jgi:hypothetical protein
MDHGEEKIKDQPLVTQLRGKARQVHLRALIVAVIVTLVVLVFPRI